MKVSDKHLIVIAGPTAVGKTKVAIEVAKHFKTHIISADSRQLFSELNIGTAKPSPTELAEIPHHFINSHSISEEYDAAQYGRDALNVVLNLFKQNNYTVLCGGSGLYIKALIDGFDEIPEVGLEIRAGLIKEYAEKGIPWLQEKMRQLDPEYFDKIDQQNPHRLIRALEVKIGTGASISTFQKNRKAQHNFNVIKIGLELPRDVLYENINKRMDEMISNGLFEEATKLYPFRTHQALQTVGYQEIFEFMDGAYDKEETIRLLKRNSRRYAKRQLTWFKRDVDMKWFSPEQLSEIVHYISSYEIGDPH